MFDWTSQSLLFALANSWADAPPLVPASAKPTLPSPLLPLEVSPDPETTYTIANNPATPTTTCCKLVILRHV